MTLSFERPVDSRAHALAHENVPGSYRWQYFDAISSDESVAIVAIFLVGSVFSPYYMSRFERGEKPSPRDHVAINFAMYRKHAAPLFVFSEYGRERFSEGSRGQSVGESFFERNADGSIAVHVEDFRPAFASRVRADFAFRPLAGPLRARDVHLGGEEHGWRCPMPRAAVTGEIEGASFSGTGYHDTNFGAQPPATMLASWSWGRVHHATTTRVFFDSTTKDGRRSHLEFDTESEQRSVAVLPPAVERASLRSWLLPVPKRYDCGAGEGGQRLYLRPERALERAPFYARFLASFPTRTSAYGDVGLAEHVNFQRLASPAVRYMIRHRLARPERREWGVLP